MPRQTEKNIVDEYVKLDREIKARQAKLDRLKEKLRDKHKKNPAKISFKGSHHYINISVYDRTNTNLNLMKEDYGEDIFKPYETETECVKLLINHKPKPWDA